MGFYGNITNTARTQFQFDKIYSNRYEMDSNKSIDGIYAGRYVLIEYDAQLNLDNFWRVEIISTHDINGVTYYTFNYNPSHNNIIQNDTILTKDIASAADFQIVYTATLDTDASGGTYAKNPKFYMYQPNIMPHNNLAYYEAISETAIENIPNYTINYNIDVKVYGAGRAYDSTVWQKAYIDGVEKYIMIAELNTVVPTFDISADAPTQSPLIPHFDTHSTDVYYKLHWQPSWGLRVRSSENQEGPAFDIHGVEIANTSVPYSETLNKSMRSDETTTWKRTEYNTATGQSYIRYWNPYSKAWEDNPSDINAAIYYNKAGFLPEKISIKDENTDRINLDPIGYSGHKYNDHQGLVGSTSPQVDIQELSIMLPSIGNSIAKMWNIVYGNFEQNDNSDNRNMDISWDSTKGLRLVREDKNGHGFTYEPSKVETLAGAINSVHDLMGMIIESPEGIVLDSDYAESVDDKHIYYSNGKYWRKAIEYNYTKYEDTEILENTELYVISDDNNLYYPGCKWNMNVFPIPEGVILGTRTAYPTFKELKNFARELNTIHGLILKTNYMLLYGDSFTRDQSTVQGCINVLNDIIAKFEFINPGEIMTVDSYGRIHSTPYTTSQEYDNFNFGKLKANGVPEMIEATEDRWIRLDIDPDAAHPLITFKHEFTEAADSQTTTTADKNNGNGDGNNAYDDDVLKFYTPIVDTTGHIVGHNIETVTLPYGYKFYKTTGHSTNETTDLDTIQDTVSVDGATVTAGTPVAASSMNADNTKDTINIDPFNKWIQTKLTDDKLVIAHEIHGVKTDVKATNLNLDNVASTNNGDKIVIQDITFDAAGHVKSNQEHTYTLPYGFKTIKTNGRSTEVSENATGTPTIPNVVAESTQDTLTINSGNKWVRIDTNANSDTLTIRHDVHNFESGNHSIKYGLESNKNIVALDSNNIFEVPVFKFDEAGHITFAETHTIQLPENFTNINILNTNSSSVAVNGASSAGNIAADTLTDTFTMDIGNRWIQISTDTNNDKITFYHAAPGNQANTSLTGNETPNFGTTFKIPEIKYDEAGHVSGVSSHTVQLPLPSLNDLTATTASVLTGISMNDATGAITQTNANVGSLALTGYSLGINNGAIIATDTINTAFGKLQVQLNNEVKARQDEITRLEGLISTLTANLTNLTTSFNTLNNEFIALKTKVDLEHPLEEEGTTPKT